MRRQSKFIETPRFELIELAKISAAKDEILAAQTEVSKAQWRFFAAPRGKKLERENQLKDARHRLLRAELELDRLGKNNE